MKGDVLNLVECVQVIKKRKVSIAVVTLLVTAAGLAYAFLFRPVLYSAEGVLRIGRVAERMIEPAEAVAVAGRSPDRLRRALAEVVPDDAAAPAKDRLAKSARLTVEERGRGPSRVDLLRISVSWPEPRGAAALAEALGTMIVDEHRERFRELVSAESERLREIEEDLKRLSAMIDRMEETREGLVERGDAASVEYVLLEAGIESRLRLLTGLRREAHQQKLALDEPATFPTGFLSRPAPPARPGPRRRLAITAAAFVLGLAVSITAAFVREYLGVAG